MSETIRKSAGREFHAAGPRRRRRAFWICYAVAVWRSSSYLSENADRNVSLWRWYAARCRADNVDTSCRRGYIRLVLQCLLREVMKLQNNGTSPGTLCQTLYLEQFRHGTSTVASVVNLFRPTTVASLSHWTSTVVYNTMSVTQRVARVRLRQLRLALSISIQIIEELTADGQIIRTGSI